MFSKQIDKKTALELAAKGKEVQVMVPAGKDSGWEGMTPDPPPTGKKPKKALDVGKLVALHNAGWPAAKIADELRVTERTVYAHLQKMREEGESREENTENAGTGTGT